MPLTSEQIVDALRPVQDPELHRSIVDLVSELEEREQAGALSAALLAGMYAASGGEDPWAGITVASRLLDGPRRKRNEADRLAARGDRRQHLAPDRCYHQRDQQGEEQLSHGRPV